MELKKRFFLKVAGLFGMITAMNTLISLFLYYYSFTLIESRVKTNSFFNSGFYIPIAIFIIAFILYFLGYSNEKMLNGESKFNRSLENQVVGLILTIIGILNIQGVVSQIIYYNDSMKHTYQGLIAYSRFQIYISIVVALLPLTIGLILMLFRFRKKTVYDITEY